MPNQLYQHYNLNTPNNEYILTQSTASQIEVPGAKCLSVLQYDKPYQAYAKNRTEAQYVTNIDGACFPTSTLPYACQDTGYAQTNPVPYPISKNYVLPGGVLTAPRFFKSVNPRTAMSQVRQAPRVPSQFFTGP